jgi:hypothetical protein
MTRNKKLFRVLLLAVIIGFVTFCYLNTNYFIKEQEWKHRDGGSVGDWLEFDDSLLSIRGRTIYKNGAATGEVIVCLGKMLIIKETLTGEKGYYINKTSFRF